MSTRMIQDVLPKSLYTHRELLQDQLLHDIFSELSHTYALGVHKYAYMNKFLQDALPNINIVRDTLPWEMADFPYTSDSVSIYEEEAD